MIQVPVPMWMTLVLTWLNGIFAATGEARPIDLAELLVHSAGYRPPPHLVYAPRDTTLFVNFFTAGEQQLRVGAASVRVAQRTAFPESGDIELRLEPAGRATFTLAVRIPAWARGEIAWSAAHRFEFPDVPAATLVINGQAVRTTFDRGYARVTRQWRSGDVVHVYLPMPEHRLLPADPHCPAVQRGPLISCRG